MLESEVRDMTVGQIIIGYVYHAKEFKVVWDGTGEEAGHLAGIFIYSPYNYPHPTPPQRLITRNHLYDSKSEPGVSAPYSQWQ